MKILHIPEHYQEDSPDSREEMKDRQKYNQWVPKSEYDKLVEALEATEKITHVQSAQLAAKDTRIDELLEGAGISYHDRRNKDLRIAALEKAIIDIKNFWNSIDTPKAHYIGDRCDDVVNPGLKQKWCEKCQCKYYTKCACHLKDNS